MYIAIAVKAQRKKMKENKNTNVHKKTHRYIYVKRQKTKALWNILSHIVYSTHAQKYVYICIMSIQSTHRWQNTKACIQLFFSSLFRLAITYPLRVNLNFFLQFSIQYMNKLCLHDHNKKKH